MPQADFGPDESNTIYGKAKVNAVLRVFLVFIVWSNSSIFIVRWTLNSIKFFFSEELDYINITRKKIICVGLFNLSNCQKIIAFVS